MIRFAACEQCFPCWGALALKMAHEAGFAGMQITDGGGYLQPHPQNNGFVEYERFGLDLRRKDSFPLTDPFVQNYYREASQQYGVELMGIYLYLLDHQGFVKFSKETPQGQQCLETIRNAAKSAAEMGIPRVTLPMNGMFGIAQHTYAFEKLEYAAQVGAEYGVEMLFTTDGSAEYQKDLMDRLDGRVKVSLNTVSPLLYVTGTGASMIQALGAERLGLLRFQDLTADGEGFVTKETSRQALLGRGAGQTAEAAAAAQAVGYSGWVLSETPYYSPDLFQESGDTYVSLAGRDLETLKRLLGTGGEV